MSETAEKKCQCGGKMTASELMIGIFSGATVRVPDGSNFPKDYMVVPFVCEKCGKIELYAAKNQDGSMVFGGVFIG